MVYTALAVVSARMLCVVPCQDIDRRMRVWRCVGERFY